MTGFAREELIGTKGKDAAALYHNADQALYEAKRLGRNRTCRYNANRGRELGLHRGGARHEPLESMMELALGADAKHPWLAGHARRVADLASRLAAFAGWTPVAIMLIQTAWRPMPSRRAHSCSRSPTRTTR